MKMKCTIGGLSCGEVSVRRGDVFDMDDDDMVASLIEHGLAVKVVEPVAEVVPDEPASEKKSGGKKSGGGR